MSINSKEKRRLDQIAEKYGDVPDVEERQNRLQAEYVVQFCRGKLLEMGVGDGVWIDLLVDRCGPIDVVDAVGSLLGECELTHGSDVNFFCSLFEDFEPTGKYDTINMAHILEHVQDPVALLKRVGGWLKLDGRINVLVPNAGSIHRRLGVALGALRQISDLNGSDVRFGHRRVYTILQLKRHVVEAGLEIIYEKGLGMKPLHNDAMESWPNGLLAGAFKLGLDLPIELSSALFFQLQKRGGSDDGD